MKIVFRVDAALHIGSGHVMRCLTLADRLRDLGAEVAFICRDFAGHLIEHIRAKAYEVCVLPPLTWDNQADFSDDASTWLGLPARDDAAQSLAFLLTRSPVDWLIVDHYGIDAEWEKIIAPHVRKLAVIDDLANRAHVCDLLLDQNLGCSQAKYAPFCPPETRFLLGTNFALLREEFAAWRERSLARRAQPQLQQILISMGGVDKDDWTSRILKILRQSACWQTCRIVVVMGKNAPHQARVAKLLECPADNFPADKNDKILRVQADNMAELLTQSDLVIGAAGSSAWERCALGVPTIQAVIADNQKSIAEFLQTSGAAKSWNGAAEDLLHLLQFLTDHTATLLKMSQAASQICDAKGAARVALALMKED